MDDMTVALNKKKTTGRSREKHPTIKVSEGNRLGNMAMFNVAP